MSLKLAAVIKAKYVRTNYVPQGGRGINLTECCENTVF
jgi:hypothetical protein